MFKDRILSLFTINCDTSASRLMLFNIAAGRQPIKIYVRTFQMNVSADKIMHFLGGMAGVLTDCFLYSFDFARTALAADVKGTRLFRR